MSRSDTPATAATTTPTPTPPMQKLFGVTKAGVFFAIDVSNGEPAIIRDLSQAGEEGNVPVTAVTGPVISSPALSSESILVFGDAAGILRALDTSSGMELWEVTLAPGVPVRSSPAIGADGTIYVGADDGVLYAVTAR